MHFSTYQLFEAPKQSKRNLAKNKCSFKKTWFQIEQNFEGQSPHERFPKLINILFMELPFKWTLGTAEALFNILNMVHKAIIIAILQYCNIIAIIKKESGKEAVFGVCGK